MNDPGATTSNPESSTPVRADVTRSPDASRKAGSVNHFLRIAGPQPDLSRRNRKIQHTSSR